MYVPTPQRSPKPPPRIPKGIAGSRGSQDPPGVAVSQAKGDSLPVLDLAAGSLFLGALAFFLESSSHGAPSRTRCASRTGTLHRASDQLCEPLSGVAYVCLLAATGLADHDQASFGVEAIVCLAPESSFDLRREDMASLKVEP